ncbi:signal peptidase I [Priestia abyssalis]|uniref:signal peptidase I n=1 Tax=Priestia abyssalis TaxID=1221450 RepID=UPI000995ADD3|nr:signal peptidase I [Priestia abyssalis]
MENGVKKEIWSYIKTLVVALILSFLIQQFLFQPYTVKGQSMMPNLEEGNKIIINKINYLHSKPERFDMVVLKSPNADEYLVKRVIGLPGETVEYQDDVLFINSKPQKEPYLEDYKKQLLPFEQLTADFTLKEITDESKIPEGYILVLGDNRRISRDGRHFGLVKIDSVVGEVNMRYWPLKEVAFMN